MNKTEIYDFLTKNPSFFLATSEDNQPRVRGMFLYRADENGIIFHSGVFKDVFKQIENNKNVEMCFYDSKSNVQIRVRGELEIVEDDDLKDEISEHPSRQFLKPWKQSGSLKDFYNSFKVFRLKNGRALVWTFETNFAPKTDVIL